MLITIVSFFDDNFGDILIRICFQNLLKTVLENLNIKDYEIRKMHLKNIDEELLKQSDLICFAGGGLFGLSYLNFYEFLERITDIAEENKIPILISSIGVNNMDATDESEKQLKNILNKKCIKAISIRENPELFKKYAPANKDIKLVCDPGVWTQYVYDIKKANNKKPIIGINVVRGGLFKDNKKEWGLTNEITYLNDLRLVLEEKGYDYYFYTNGSFLDNNTLRHFEKEYEIPKDKLIYLNTTSELVNTISKFDFTVSIRMHSSIISYALDIPSINLIWNDKIPLFYEYIKHKENAIPIEKWNTDIIINKIEEYKKKKYQKDPQYLMTVYDYLFEEISKLTNKDCKKYSFDNVVKYLKEIKITTEEDNSDIHFKLNKAEKLYYERFLELRRVNKELNETKKKLNKKEEELNKIKNRLIFKIYRKIKRIFKKK